MTFDLQRLLRDNVRNIQPYASARDEYSGTEGIFIDANENPYHIIEGGAYNRYPDPLQRELKQKIVALKGASVDQLFLGNGSDEPIDLLIRAFCNPGKDSILILPPTYGMYKVCADLNGVEVHEVLLTKDFDIDLDKTKAAITDHTKLLFVCSPNNPTGNLVNRQAVVELLKVYKGIVVVDEAYIDFTDKPSFIHLLTEYPNLVVLQTLSKAWGLAGIRLGMAFGHVDLIRVLNKIKFPYNVNVLTQEVALKALDNEALKNAFVNEICEQREWLAQELNKVSCMLHIYPSDSNFLLVKTTDGRKIYEYLISKKIITRDRSKVDLCEGCIRITIGTKEENKALLEAIQSY